MNRCDRAVRTSGQGKQISCAATSLAARNVNNREWCMAEKFIFRPDASIMIDYATFRAEGARRSWLVGVATIQITLPRDVS